MWFFRAWHLFFQNGIQSFTNSSTMWTSKFTFLLVLSVLVLLNSFVSAENKTAKSAREGKILSLFSVVQFRNAPCRSASILTKGNGGNRNGTCFTTAECNEKGGFASGTCASGFGVCCLFLLDNSGGTTNSNCTYIRNPGFPSAVADATSVTYSISKCSCNVCYLRLDFECFTILGVGQTDELDMGGDCTDQFTIGTATNDNLPVICGQNTGQHLYVDMGTGCQNVVALNFAFNGASNERTWEIKASQIPCGSTYTPPDGCLQYHSELDGRFTTFNFLPTNDNHLANQQYSICIRQEEGYCCVQYMVCNDVAETGMTLNTKAMDLPMMGFTDTSCSMDYVGIAGSGGLCNTAAGGQLVSRYCGTKLNFVDASVSHAPICDCTAPFAVEIRTDGLSDVVGDAANTLKSRGLCLEYTQIPC